MSPATLFLRLEGPLQAWGNHESKFSVRRTYEAPTKSGVLGMACAALGIPRRAAAAEWLPQLSNLSMGVRIDSPGVRWWDFHTVGADMSMRIAEGEGKAREGAMLTRREYLCDASFLVALQGEDSLVDMLRSAFCEPKWPLYLGRKSCCLSRPILEHNGGVHESLLTALASVPWRPRLKGDPSPSAVDALLDWLPTPDQLEAPADALVWYDVPLTFEPPSHRPRFVVRESLTVGPEGLVQLAESPAQRPAPAPPRPRADYGNSEYRRKRLARLDQDHHLCVFCKAPATTVQHVTYRHAGGDESLDDLRSLCRLCHDAVTMIEYGLGMGLDRIDPKQPCWRDQILEKRGEIIRFRSLQTRRRHLAAEEVE